jgi:hypothetical protein
MGLRRCRAFEDSMLDSSIHMSTAMESRRLLYIGIREATIVALAVR